MPQDQFQISLEHHRAGRLVQAETGYRALLSRNPNHAEALHWLGVLLYQAGDASSAMPLLGRAAELLPKDPAVRSNYAHACLAAGQCDKAIAAFEGARTLGASSADLSFGLGVALHRAGRIDDAIAALRDAVARDPSHAQAWYHLAAAWRSKNEPREVRKCLNKALELDREFAPAWQALGVLEAELGHAGQSAAALRQAMRLRQSHLPTEKSVAGLQQRLTPDPLTSQLHHALADATGLLPPADVPPEQIAELFDRYADTFDEHLRDKLHYRAPELLISAIQRLNLGAPLDIIDLGCGTGLCGPLLRPLARSLRGVDLSPGTIEKARSRGVYDALDVGELVEFLRRCRGEYDLLLAADVLNYLGDLLPAMEAAHGALREGGHFAFTLEAMEGDHFRMSRRSHRFAHSRAYIQHIARICGFRFRCDEQAVLRTDAGNPVEGLVVVLQKSNEPAG